jgi:antitoxin component of RelBE/YafQ-DinJ toxin-antitoxin module
MTTQVIFKIDKKLKDKAMKKAQDEGLPFAFVLKMATQAYVEGRLEPQMVQPEKFNAKTRRILDQALKDIKAGKNLSPTFNNAKDAITYLKNRHAR